MALLKLFVVGVVFLGNRKMMLLNCISSYFILYNREKMLLRTLHDF